MADDGLRLHSDQMPEIARQVAAELRSDFQDLLRASAVPPAHPSGRPPAEGVGRDAEAFQRLIQPELDKFRGEVDKLRAQVGKLQGQVEKLQGEVLKRSDLDDLLADLSMPVKTVEERRATRHKMEGLFELHESATTWKTEILGTVVKSLAAWIAGLLTAGLAYLGIKSGGH